MLKVYEYAVNSTVDDSITDIIRHRKLIGVYDNLSDLIKQYRRAYHMNDLMLVASDDLYYDNTAELPANVVMYQLYHPTLEEYYSPVNLHGTIIITEVI